MKKNILISSVLLSSLFSAQGIQNFETFGGNFFPQSPNATPFATTGKYPVDMYKGVPIINIPLFNTTNFNAALSYNVKSVKPSTIPTWVGLGWNLEIGGSVTRIVNSGVDEVYVSGVVPNNRFSYLDNYSTLDNPNWDSLPALQSYYNSNLQFILQAEPNSVPDPDEFIINIGGLTGSFYMNEKGKWIGRTRDGRTLKIEHQYKFDFILAEKTLLGTSYIGNKTHTLKRTLYGFTIITDDGTKYIFGLDDKAVEFSSIPETVDLAFNPHIVPSSWNINEIIYPNGKKVKFTYERDERSVFVSNRGGNRSYYTQGFTTQNVGNSGSAGNLYALYSNRLNNVFLTKVEGEEFVINLTRSLANQKEYGQFDVPTNQWVPPYTHHISSYYQHKHWYKLDNISVTDKSGRMIKNIVFNYNNDPTDRLILNNVSINNIENYGFQYNSQKLPEYITDATDHWGYYNGTSFYNSGVNLNVPQDQMKNIFLNTYPNYKLPNLNLTKSQTLEKITYPTGGNTMFEYELNDYSKYGEKDIYETYLKMVSPGSNQIAGGLRIKKIKSCNENNNCINKTYSYLNDDGISSSGILPYKPIYLLEGSDPAYGLSYWEFNYNSYQSLKSEDNSVLYSKVTEVDDNGGKKETYFTNIDQADYKDKSGNRYYGWLVAPLFKQLPYLSFSLMRGKPLKEIIYSNTNKISETDYTYTKQTDYLRAYTFNSKQFGQAQSAGPFTDVGGISYGALLDAFLVNFNTSFLTHKKTVYDNVETTENIDYNYTYNVPIQKTVVSSGNTDTTNYNYAWNSSNQIMLDAHMVGVPLIEEIKSNGKTNSKVETLYPVSLPSSSSGSLILPQSARSYDISNLTANPTTEVAYDQYDSKGNVLQYTTKDGVITSIIWGYNSTQPIAKVRGVSYSVAIGLAAEIITASNADIDAGTEQILIDKLDAFRKQSVLQNAEISTYSYDPLIGVTSITPPSGIREVYLYDFANRLKEIRQDNSAGRIIKEFKYNYKQ